jgi:PAS domain S-box-containing protein
MNSPHSDSLTDDSAATPAEAPNSELEGTASHFDKASLGTPKAFAPTALAAEVVPSAEAHTGAPPATALEGIAALAANAAQLQHLSHLTRTLAGEKHFLKAVVDSTEDALAAFDARGHFSMCNRAFEAIFGLRADDLSGTNEDHLRKRLRNCLEAPDEFFEPVTDNEAPGKTILRLHVPTQEDYGIRILRWYSSPVRDESQNLLGRVVMVRDITKEYELDRMKTDFVSIVSHELRTPMTSIKGYVDLIIDGDTGEINELQREFLTTVQRNTDRLVALVNDMLDISRIESGRIEFDTRPTDLQRLIQQAVDIVAPQCAARGLTLEVSIEPTEAVPKVLVDADRVVQILINLLSNAIKFTLPPPESAGRIEVQAHIESPLAFVTIRDSGIGISAEDQEMLFEKFFRAGNSDTRQADGTGLGLPISKALLENMGGELWLESTPGEGSVFTFTLPVDTSHKARRQPRALHQAPRVLVAYDDPDGGDALASFLKLQGYAVENAYAGTEALRMLHDAYFDAAIVRLLLPGQQGFELLGKISRAGTPFALAFEPDVKTGSDSIHTLRQCEIVNLDSLLLDSLLEKNLSPNQMALCIGEIAPAVEEALAKRDTTLLSVHAPLDALVARDDQQEAGSPEFSLVVIEPALWDEQTAQLIEAWNTVSYLFVDAINEQAIWLPPVGQGDPTTLRAIQSSLDKMSHQRLEQYSRQAWGFTGL